MTWTLSGGSLLLALSVALRFLKVVHTTCGSGTGRRDTWDLTCRDVRPTLTFHSGLPSSMILLVLKFTVESRFVSGRYTRQTTQTFGLRNLNLRRHFCLTLVLGISCGTSCVYRNLSVSVPTRHDDTQGEGRCLVSDKLRSLGGVLSSRETSFPSQKVHLEKSTSDHFSPRHIEAGKKVRCH